MDAKWEAFANWLSAELERDYYESQEAFEAGWDAAIAHYNIIVDGERAEWETNGRENNP